MLAKLLSFSASSLPSVILKASAKLLFSVSNASFSVLVLAKSASVASFSVALAAKAWFVAANLALTSANSAFKSAAALVSAAFKASVVFKSLAALSCFFCKTSIAVCKALISFHA
jgi:hypothetical protein